MIDQKKHMQDLVQQLNEAAAVYYQGKDEIMSNYDYDRLYDELAALEKETGIILAGSPTQRVGYEVLSELPKETHAAPMLSLDKTKSVDALASWLEGQTGLLSWKMDMKTEHSKRRLPVATVRWERSSPTMPAPLQTSLCLSHITDI